VAHTTNPYAWELPKEKKKKEKSPVSQITTRISYLVDEEYSEDRETKCLENEDGTGEVPSPMGQHGYTVATGLVG
jgi:hypothetical protein